MQNHEIEKYIIKCMYNAPASIVEIAQNLNKDDFTHYLYKSLFVAIKKLATDGNVSAEGIMSYFAMSNGDAYEILKKGGGARKIDQLRDSTLGENPSVTEQIKELKSLTYRRNAIQYANMVKTLAESNFNPKTNAEFEDIEQMDEQFKEGAYNLAESLNTGKRIDNIGSAVDRLREEIKNGETMGIDIGLIGYPKLNKMIKRLRNGALYVFGAPEKCGKSTFMLDIAWKIALQGIPVAYCDTEMKTEEQLLRICSKMSGIEEDRIADNLLNEKEQKIVDAYWEKIKTIPFYHFNVNEMTNAEVESRVKNLQLKHGIQLLVYDYVKIQTHEAEKGRPDLILASKIDTLKEKICKQCDIPVITSGQMYPRTDERGNLNKFAETSHFTKLADVICRLDRVDPEDVDMFGATHYIELITGRKVRSDQIGTKIPYNFNMPVHEIKEM